MGEPQLRGYKVAILVEDNFEQVELVEPRKALDHAGADTLVLAPRTGKVRGMHHDERGDGFSVDIPIDQADPGDFDAVLLPGGALNADKLRMNEAARDFVKQFDRQGKPIAVICHAPWLLVSSGLVRGRTLTSYPTIQDDIRNAGGIWQDRQVVRDRNWVSSRSPKDIPAFNEAMIDLFIEHASEHQGAQAEAAVMGAGSGDRDSGNPGGGQGRTDTVGGSGVFPASDPHAPEDARAHGEASWGQGERGAQGYEDHGSSELNLGSDKPEK